MGGDHFEGPVEQIGNRIIGGESCASHVTFLSLPLSLLLQLLLLLLATEGLSPGGGRGSGHASLHEAETTLKSVC